jgi:hypothetical protein
MQTAATTDIPSENFGVVRIRRRTFNAGSYAGLMFTGRIPADGESSLAFGVDGTVHFGGQTYARGSFAQSLRGGQGDLNSTAGIVAFERRAGSGLSYTQSFGWTGSSFDPGIGFVDRDGIFRYDGAADYLWVLDRDNALYRHGPGIEVLALTRTDGGLESLEIAPAWQIRWKSGVNLDLEANFAVEDVAEPFELGETTIPGGRYQFTSIRGFLTLPPTWRFSSRMYARYGQYFDGRWLLIALRPFWRASEHLEIGLDYERTRAEFHEREARFDSDILRLRAHGALDRSLSMSAFVQYNSLTKRLSADARVRYNFAEGRDLYIIYSEGLRVDNVTRRLHTLGERSILVKFSYAMIYGW